MTQTWPLRCGDVDALIDRVANVQQTLPRFGAHVSIAGGHDRAIHLASDLGCEVVQVFTKNNMQWSAPPLQPAAVDAYRAALSDSPIQAVFAHSGYLINLAADDPGNREKSRQSLVDELERCRALQLPFIVLHPGSHRGQGVEVGLSRVIESLDWVFERFDGETRIALEFTAGQGATLGRTIEEIAFLLSHSRHAERLVVCLDTCHLFAAGYDIRSQDGIDHFVSAFCQQIPWEKIACVHINDSKCDLGSNKDRHELLGDGKIGWPCFEALIARADFQGIPFCLETPKGKDNINDRRTLMALKDIRDRLQNDHHQPGKNAQAPAFTQSAPRA